eukprot:15365091-Ditylum_brightwellii.AAC.1
MLSLRDVNIYPLVLIGPLVASKLLGDSTTLFPLSSNLFLVLLSCCAIFATRFILYKCDRHLPPYAPVTLFEVLTNGEDFPYFVSRLVQSVGPIFRLRKTPLMDIIIVNDALVAKAILNNPSSLKPRKFYGKIDRTVDGKTIPYITTKEGDVWKNTRQSCYLTNKISLHF